MSCAVVHYFCLSVLIYLLSRQRSCYIFASACYPRLDLDSISNSYNELSMVCPVSLFDLAGYQACGLIAKLLFVGNLTEAHLGIFEAMNIQLAAMKLANTTRRNFLRYVFHEVGVTSRLPSVCHADRGSFIAILWIICWLDCFCCSLWQLGLPHHLCPALSCRAVPCLSVRPTDSVCDLKGHRLDRPP